MGYYLDDEEQQLVEDFEKVLEEGTLESISKLDVRKKELRQIARNTLNKTRNINIRFTDRDLHRLKSKAIEKKAYLIRLWLLLYCIKPLPQNSSRYLPLWPAKPYAELQ